MLNLNPLGSLPTYLCTYSVPRSLTAIAYFKGFTQDWRQKGTLVSPTECLRKTQMKTLKISRLLSVASAIWNASFILQHNRTGNRNSPQETDYYVNYILKSRTKKGLGFNNYLHKLNTAKSLVGHHYRYSKKKSKLRNGFVPEQVTSEL